MAIILLHMYYSFIFIQIHTSPFFVSQKTTQCSCLSGLLNAYTTVFEKKPH